MKEKDAKERLDAAARLIDTARSKLDGTGPIDDEMIHIATAVDDACSALSEIPPGQRQAFKPRLISLYDELARLANELWQRHQVLKRELGEITARQRAQSAYAKPPSPSLKSKS